MCLLFEQIKLLFEQIKCLKLKLNVNILIIFHSDEFVCIVVKILTRLHILLFCVLTVSVC